MTTFSLPAVLGFKPGSKVSVINPPAGFVQKLNPLPDGVEFLITSTTGLDLILFFPHDTLDLVERLPALARAMAVTGGIWVCWSTQASGRRALSEPFIRQAALDIGLVDDKRCALDAVWAGLRLVWKPRGRIERPPSVRRRAPAAEA